MALTLPVTTTRVVSIDEYLDYVRREVDLTDLESLAASASMLRALANDRMLIVRRLNDQIRDWSATGMLASGQSVLLGRGDGFYVRYNLWPSTADVAGGRVYQEQFSYNIPHDHNFTFLTVGYLGPGYDTDIYEYDYEKVAGYVGESVDIRFLEKVRFSAGKVMLYRANRDIHIQYPPEELTITLNLIVSDPDVRIRDQFFFDLAQKTIVSFFPDADVPKRASFVRMAGYLGNDDTRQILTDLSRDHPCRRARLSAFEALCLRTPDDAATIWERATQDPAPLVANTARDRLKALEK